MSKIQEIDPQTLVTQINNLLLDFERTSVLLGISLPDETKAELIEQQGNAAATLAQLLLLARDRGWMIHLDHPLLKQAIPETELAATSTPKPQVSKEEPSLSESHLSDIVKRLVACVDQNREFKQITTIFGEFTVLPTDDRPTLSTLLAFMVARLRRRTKKHHGVWPTVFSEINAFASRHDLERVYGTFAIDTPQVSWDQDAAGHLMRLREITSNPP